MECEQIMVIHVNLYSRVDEEPNVDITRFLDLLKDFN